MNCAVSISERNHAHQCGQDEARQEELARITQKLAKDLLVGRGNEAGGRRRCFSDVVDAALESEQLEDLLIQAANDKRHPLRQVMEAAAESVAGELAENALDERIKAEQEAAATAAHEDREW